MPQLTFKPDENVTFPVMTTFEGTPADLPADGLFDVHSLYVLRDGQPINLDRSFGVTFSSVSGAGNYIATINRKELVTESGVEFVQQNGDVINFAEIANINGGQVFGGNQQATIETDLGQAVSDMQQTLTTIAPVAPDIPLESSNVRQGVVFGKIGDEQIGTFSPVCDVAGSGNIVDAVLKPMFEAVLIEARVCSYTNRLLLDAMYGRQNIDEWANLENCEDDAQSKREITARIQLEINRVESYLDDSLRHLYCTPFECPVPPTIEAITTALVGHNLRDARYMNEEDTVVLRKYERAMNTLHQLKEGSIRVPGFAVKAHPQFE